MPGGSVPIIPEPVLHLGPGPWAGCRAANLGLGRTDVAEDHPRQGHDPGLQLEYPSLPGQEPTLPCMRWLPSPALTSAGHFTH